MSDIEEIAGEMLEEEVDPYSQSIAEKMQIARNVVIQCQKVHKTRSRFHADEIQNIIKYTGATEETIRIADMSLEQTKTFHEWFKEQEPVEADLKFLDFERIRGLILEQYTKKIQIPTETNLWGLLDCRTPRGRHDYKRITNGIKIHGFIWKRLSGTKKSIVVERTDQSMKRMEYLTKMKAFREAGRPIVYVDPSFYYYQLAVSPQHGLLHMGFHGLKNAVEMSTDKFTIIHLIPVLPPNSVVVLKEDFHFEEEVPTPSTAKRDMVNWLSDHKIPHNPVLHRADLYAMIKKFKHLGNCNNSMRKILKSHGHDVIYRPKKLKNIDYLKIMWPGDPSTRCKTVTISKLKDKTIAEWENVEKTLVSREEKLYQEDMLMEAVVDKLITLAKYGELSKADLNECENTLTSDDYCSSIIYDY